MPVKLTIRLMNPEDAERLMQAFRDGKLAELGVLDVKPVEQNLNDATENKWRSTESKRRDNPKQDDVPPRG